MKNWNFYTGAAVAALLMLGSPAFAENRHVQSMKGALDRVSADIKAGQFENAAGSFKAFDDEWDSVEVSVKRGSKKAYREIESAMDEVRFAIRRKSEADGAQALDKLRRLLDTHARLFP